MGDTSNILDKGSPPRMRGKGMDEERFAQYTRITPAYAGKRSCPFPHRVKSWDHPRVCGEKRIYWRHRGLC